MDKLFRMLLGRYNAPAGDDGGDGGDGGDEGDKGATAPGNLLENANKDDPSGDGATDASSGDGATTGTTTTGDADWRDEFAGDDKALRAQIDRYATPADFGQGHMSAVNRIQQGFRQPTLPDNATDEDRVAFRKEMGVPDEASGYIESMPEGLVIGDDDKQGFDSLAAFMHEQNATPEQFHNIAGWYNEYQEKQQAEVADEINQYNATSEDTLRKEWGTDYRANMNVGLNFIEQNMSEEAVDNLSGAVGGDGMPLLSNPAFLNFLATQGRQINPISQVISGAGAGVETLADEIKDIEAKIGSDAYDDDAQARLLVLYEAQEKHEGMRKTG